MSLKKGLIFFLIFFSFNLSLLIGSVFNVAFAEEPTVVDIPEGYEKGRVCPPAPEGDISICGTVRNIQKQKDDDIYFTGEPIEGVFIVSYLGKEYSDIKKPSTFVWTNKDGEYWINIHKYSGDEGTNYLAFFCKRGSNITLEDLYVVDTGTVDQPFFDVGLTCKGSAPDLDLEPFDSIGFIDRNGFLTCGEERLTYEAETDDHTATATINVAKANIDGTYEGNVFDPLNLQADDVPADQAQLSRESLEGRHEAEYLKDINHTSLINWFTTGFTPAYVPKYGLETARPLPACSYVESSNTTVTDGVVNSYIAGGSAIGLAPPNVWETLLANIDPGLLNETEVCREDSGNIKKLKDMEIGDPDYPYQLLFELIGDKDFNTDLPKSDMKYKAINDSGYNAVETDPEEDCRDRLWSDYRAQRPFKSCSETRHPAVSEALRFLGEFDDYAPQDLLKSPFEIIDDSNPGLDLPGGIYRVGLPQMHCSCSTIEGGECDFPTPLQGLSHDNQVISGYEINAETAAAAADDFYQQQLLFAWANIFKNLIATFEVWAGNLLDAIYGGNECVSQYDYDIVAECDAGEPICEATTECRDEITGAKCYDELNEYCNCYDVYKKYRFEYQGGACDGDVTYDLIVDSEVKNEPGDKLKSSSEYQYRAFASPFATVGSVGSEYYSDQKVTDGTTNEKGEAAKFRNKQGTNSTVTYTDLNRFILTVNTADSADLINPKEYTHDVITLEAGECDGNYFKQVEGVPEQVTFDGGLFYFNSTYLPILSANPLDLPAYGYAQARTGVPCEILAGIHHIEGTSKQSASLQDGHPIGEDQLPADAVVAANILKSKGYFFGKMDIKSWNFQDFTWALDYYNGPGNENCLGSPYAGIPGNCPAKFVGEDHLYPMAMLDAKHGQMYVRYCADHTLCAVPFLFQKTGVWATSIQLNDKIKSGL
ncbi:MAG: hypothetical protein UU77_C0001G0015 [candidate division WWE3 bacterium GW2011_GWC1_41_7]|uniref:Uncharacterized protein n=3 Tax=Katanobacteria TaxID=422282 RepID=A0A0G0ZKD5_UNCKA|nr:MAG: hypothetical protein UU72_C0003G0016 [candidate division WWE3 bacterium GW2011_GWB1_41_6]KKS21520.1 MAG: hypothetical protein UU77_C0001G0015 [candidate division WWE3 bacterium GW2011_GWC1_41_7]KKS22521.1 MAG: hypothetical protein UU80_C0006G0047 [candidate division WWE3 bacterium GW2011_GWA1_41_8]